MVAVFALSLGACIESLGIPQAYTPYHPPADWARYWAQDEACSGVTGDVSRIGWFTIASNRIELPDSQVVWVAWHRPDEIFLAEDRITGDSAAAAKLVRHEMLHDLLQTPTHPAAFSACGLAY